MSSPEVIDVSDDDDETIVLDSSEEDSDIIISVSHFSLIFTSIHF